MAGFFQEFTGYRYADFSSKIDSVGVPKTASSTSSDSENYGTRVGRKYLENLFLTDAQVSKTINTYKKLLLQAGYRIVAEKKTEQKQYDEFFKEMGKVGMRYKLEQLLGKIIFDLSLYGMAYVERVYDTSGRYIVDLKPIDAKLMDYVRNTHNTIMTDREQNPLGYTMDCGYYSDGIGDIPPRGSKVTSGHIFLEPKRIACFILDPYGNGFEGMGKIEPAYKQITRKQKIEEAASNAIYNAADSLMYAIVGDNLRKPSEQLMNATLKTLQNWTTNRRAVFANPTQVGSMKVEQSPQVQELLKYLRNDQAIAAGMSLGLATGSGDNNKSTQNTERKDFNTQLNAMAREIATQFTSKILDELYEVNKYSCKAAMVWNNVSVDDRTDMVGILKTLFDMQAISSKEARLYAKNVLDLETDDEEWEEFIKHTERLPEMPNVSEDAPLAKKEKKEVLNSKDTKNEIAVKKNIKKSKDNYEEVRE